MQQAIPIVFCDNLKIEIGSPKNILDPPFVASYKL